MKEKLANKIKLIVAVVLIVAAFFAGYKVGKVKFFSEDVKINITVLKQELKAINELATYEYSYTDQFTESKSIKFADKFNIPFTSNSYTISYDGVIKAGVDLNNIDLELKDDAVIVRLPIARVLDQYPVVSSIKVTDQKNSILNPFDIQEIFDLIAERNYAQENLATDKGLLTLSQEHAKTIVRQFITSVYGEEINIKFE